MQTWKSLKDQYRKQDERSRGSPQMSSERGGGKTHEIVGTYTVDDRDGAPYE